MGFFRILFGLWLSWIAVRVVQHFVQAKLSPKTPEPQINPGGKGKMLELVACPYCGVFTASPCTNPDCPGRGI